MRAVLGFFRLLPLDAASNLAGAAAHFSGPRLGISRRAARNIARAFPERDPAAIAGLVGVMWDNLGRTVAELAHLRDVDCFATGGRVEVVGVEHLDRARDDGQGGIFFAAHLGWWDLPALALAQRGLDVQMVYRELNNPRVDAVVQRARNPMGKYLGKGREGARVMIAGLRAGRHFGMLVDQKMNDGIAVPFFGRAAMTAPALAQFAVRDGVPMFPVRCERTGGARFRLTFYPPLAPAETGDRARDIAETTTRVNAMLEDWIRARPEQWLWLHNRWPD